MIIISKKKKLDTTLKCMSLDFKNDIMNVPHELRPQKCFGN